MIRGDVFLQDLKLAFRAMRRHRAMALLSILSLTIGIAANTAVFSFLSTLLLTKLPVRDPQDLVELLVTHRTETQNRFSWEDYERLRDHFSSFDGVVGWFSRELSAEIGEAATQVRATLVTGNFFDVLGVQPALGRVLTLADDVPGASEAVLGHAYWRSAFQADPAVLGRVIRVNQVPFTIVGVASPEFKGAEIDFPRDIFIPIRTVERLIPGSQLLTTRSTYWITVLARLKPGVTQDMARAEIQPLWPRLLWEAGIRPPDGFQQKIDLAPGQGGASVVRRQYSRALVILMVLVALVFLVICANIASVLLVRATGRRRETAVRVALGSTRTRIVSQWLTESLVLAAIGACAGLAASRWFARGLLAFLPANQAAFLSFQLDGRLFVFAAAAALITCLICGVVPVLGLADAAPARLMNDTARGSSGGRNLALIRAVVVGQMVVCSMLIVGALLFTRSLGNLVRSDHGFERESLLVAGPPTTSRSQSHEDIRTLTRETLLRLSGLGVIQSASSSALVPLSGRQWWDPANVPGYMPGRDETNTVYINAVTPRYFETWGTRVIAGREFDESDRPGRQRVAIVSESFAQHYFKGDALNRTFSVGTREEGTLEEQLENLRIVGIVENTKYHTPREATKDLVYIAWDQSTWINPPYIEARVAPGVSVESAVEQVRRVTDEVFKIPVEVRPYASFFETALERDRLVATLSGLFGVVGVVLSIIGVYGVMAYAVATRTPEIGVRLSLGARRPAVLWMIVRESLTLAAVGVAIGIPVALVATRPLGSLLFGLAPSDPTALAATTLCLVVTAALGALVPAVRATRVDPVVALRTE